MVLAPGIGKIDHLHLARLEKAAWTGHGAHVRHDMSRHDSWGLCRQVFVIVIAHYDQVAARAGHGDKEQLSRRILILVV